MAKLQDVALSAGVSTATVSLVLAGKDEGRVSRKTSEKVKATAKELGYVGNAAASSLRTRTTHTIGFLSDYIASTPYAVEVIESANRVAGDNDQLLMLVNTEGSKKAEQFAVEEFLRRGVTGTVIAAMFHREVEVSPQVGTRRGDPGRLLQGPNDPSGCPGRTPGNPRRNATAARSRAYSHRVPW